MKLPAVMLLCIAVFSARGQTVATTANVLHPIMKDPNHRNAVSSVDRDPQEKASLYQSAAPATPATPASAHPAAPVEIVARIDSSLAVSKLNLIGTVNGLKGRLSVTNLGTDTTTPLAQFVIRDQKGAQIGLTSKSGSPLAPNESEKIEVVATNLNAIDLKLVRVSAEPEKK
jgi:hypothetical protein